MTGQSVRVVLDKVSCRPRTRRGTPPVGGCLLSACLGGGEEKEEPGLLLEVPVLVPRVVGLVTSEREDAVPMEKDRESQRDDPRYSRDDVGERHDGDPGGPSVVSWLGPPSQPDARDDDHADQSKASQGHDCGCSPVRVFIGDEVIRPDGQPDRYEDIYDLLPSGRSIRLHYPAIVVEGVRGVRTRPKSLRRPSARSS